MYSTHSPQVPKAAAAPAAAAGAAAAPDAVAAATARAAEIASKLGLAPSIRPPGPPGAAAAAAVAPAPMPGAPSMPPPVRPPPAAFMPKPLRLDAQGREIDEFGNVIERKIAPVATLKVNQRAAAEAAAAGAAAEYFDPRMGAAPGAAGRRRRGGGLEFVEQGTFQKEAELMRLRQQYGDAAVRKRLARARGPAGPGLNPNLVPIGGGGGDGSGYMAAAAAAAGGEGDAAAGGEGAAAAAGVSEEDALRAALPEGAEVPEVEWWDKPLLVGGAYPPAPAAADGSGSGDGGGQDLLLDPAAVKISKITIYVEHPVPIEPPAEAPPPPPQPLKLTAKELKKLRTQRRQAREKEKQELVRQGLLEPPKPKVKISNLMRVLGAESAADPTAIEREVRKQMAERQAAHDDRNVARMLTPAERREKKAKKLFDETGLDALTAVYRVEDLSNGQHRFKVDVNAKENHMSGAMVSCPDFSVVVVEGCAKSLKRYHKLMLRRIDWSQRPEPRAGAAAGGALGGAGGGEGMDEDGGGGGGGEEEEEDEEGGGGAAAARENACHLVWEGVVKEPAFKEFERHDVPTAAAARALLEHAGVAHYWDAAANFDPAAAPLPSAVL